MSPLCLLSLLAALDPCAEVAPAPLADPAEAAVYLRVGRAEALEGRAEPATAALVRSLSLDPASREARSELARLCQGSDGYQNRVDEALSLLDKGDPRGALEKLQRLRSAEEDLDRTMLEGICRYQLGEDEQAKALLERARKDPTLNQSAELFLGLIALRAGNSDEAAEKFEPLISVGNRALTSTAGDLLRLARQEGKVQLTASTEAGFDSNVDLASGTPFPAGSADGVAQLGGSLGFHPTGRTGPFALVAGAYRRIATLSGYDTGLAAGALGWQLDRRELAASLEYGFDYLTFSDAPYLTTHHLAASGRWSWPQLALAGAYVGRWENFLSRPPAAGQSLPLAPGQTENSGYSGLRHLVLLEASHRFAGGSVLGAGYGASQDSTADSALAYFEHGPELRALLRASPGARYLFRATLRQREYQAFDVDLGLRRSELAVEGQLRGEWDFSSRWEVFAQLEAQARSSNVPALSNSRVVGVLGLAFFLGWP